MATINELKTLALHAAKGTAPANFTADNVEVAFRGEMSKLAGSYLEFQKNKYEIFEIIMSAADEIVPNKVIDSMAPFAEVVRVGFKQKAVFRKKVGSQRAKLFLTRAAAAGVYETFRLDHTDYTVDTYAIGGATTVDFQRFLDGAETMAELIDIVTNGMVDAIYGEVQRALRDAINASGRPAANKYIGSSFDGTEMMKLISTVKAYGTSAVIFAPPEFVAAMGPDAIVPVGTNYQGVYHPQDIDAIHTTGYVNLFRGTPIVQIPQSFIDESNTKTWIDPQFAYILPAGREKVVKVVLEGDQQMYDFQNRDGSMEFHTYRLMGVAILAHHNWAVYQNTSINQTLGSPYDI